MNLGLCSLERALIFGRFRKWHIETKIDIPHMTIVPCNVTRVADWPQDIAVWETVWIWARQQLCARLSSTSNGAFCATPMNPNPQFAVSLRDFDRSAPVDSCVVMFATRSPSRVFVASVPMSKPIIETCTDAPSRIQFRSLSPKKMSPVSLIRSNAVRFAPPRIPCVANNRLEYNAFSRFGLVLFQTRATKVRLARDSIAK